MSEREQRRPRIVHLFQNDCPGGGCVAIVDQIRHLDAYDHVALHGGRGRVSIACGEVGARDVILPLDSAYKWPIGLPALWFHLLTIRPDLVVLHGQWIAPVGALCARMAGIANIVYLVQWPSFYTDWDPVRKVRNWLCESIPCRLSRRILVLSESNRRQFLKRKFGRESKITCLPNAVDQSRLPSDDQVKQVRIEHGWDDGCCHVVSVSRLTDQKRVDWLLHSWQSVTKKCANARLWIVGDGEEKARLHLLHAELGLDDTCTFLGARPDGINYMAAADIVAMTSVYEASPYVPVEAMACGRAIVASDADGVRDRVTDGREGFLVEKEDFETFAARIIELIENPELRKRMGTEGQKTAASYSIGAVMPLYDEFYAEALGNPSPTV